jgi:hypothetical protein
MNRTAEHPLTTAFVAPPTNPADFSLVLGGPLFQLWRRFGMAGDALQLLRRRLVFLTLLAWAPLAVLSIAEGHAWDGSGLPFLRDVELHARFLLAMPLLIVAELVVHTRMRPVVGQFLDRGLIADSDRPAFDAAIQSAIRLRNSVRAELALIAFVYVVGVGVVWRTQTGLDVASWQGASIDGRWQPTLAGWWLALFSLPLFQFLLLRWYFRVFLWTRFLWHVSRLDLKLVPTHPDRCGGLGFLSGIVYAFTPLLLAQGVVLSGMIAARIFYAGAQLPQFKVDLIGLTAVMVLVVLAPLLVFGRRLEAAKRLGLREYGTLAQRYVREYDEKWLRGTPPDEPFVGSADIQSLADLGNSFDVIKEMRLVPFTITTVFQLAVVTLVPVLPLMLTMIPLEELLDRLIKMVF